MIGYPRWKIVLVAIVMVIGIFLALPNVFGEESALQLAADRAAVTDADSKAVVQVLKDKGVTPSGVFLEQGRLTLRFASTTDQLKARDIITEARPNQFTIALSQASRVPAWMRAMGLGPVKLGLDLRGGVYLVYQVDIQGAVKQLLDRHEQDFRAALRNAKVAVPGRGRRLPRQSGARPVSRRGQFRQGQGRDPRRQPQFEFHGRDGGRIAGAGIAAHAAGDQGTPDLRHSAKHRHSAQSPQQSGTRRLRAAGCAGGRRSHRHPVAGTAKLRRSEEDPRQNGDPGISHGR